MNNKINQKKIIVTGGAGFVGSNLCERLLNEDNIVYCIDNFSTGFKENIQHLMSDRNFHFLEHDITNTIPLEFEGLDEIYNLACPASPVQYQNLSIETLKVCTYGLFNIIDLAMHYNSKILHTSTSEVYGDPLIHPQNESYWGNVNSFGPRACYDEGKRCAEAILYEYKTKHNLDIRIIRIFNTYGPKMDEQDGRVVSNFIIQALNNLDITIHGAGSQTRSFQYIDDLVDGMLLIMKNKEKIDTPINLGNPNEMSIKNLSKTILELIPESKSKIIFQEQSIDDPKRRLPDIALAEKFLQWKPKVELKKGLKETIQYFRDIKK